GLLGAYARRNTAMWPVSNIHIVSRMKSVVLKNCFVSFTLLPPVRHEAQAGSYEALISPPARSGLLYFQASSLNFHTPRDILLPCLHISGKHRGFDSLKVVRKGGKKGSLAIHPQAAQRIPDYLDRAGHGEDLEGPLFRPVRDNRKGLEPRRPLDPDVIDRTLRKYARHIGLSRGYSAHSMRATFITTALDNGASLEDVQS